MTMTKKFGKKNKTFGLVKYPSVMTKPPRLSKQVYKAGTRKVKKSKSR